MRTFAKLFCFALLALSPAARAFACGVSGPDGVWSCSLQEHEEAERLRWRLGVSGVVSATELRFDRGMRADQRRNALFAAVAYAPTRTLTLLGSAGAAFGGSLTTSRERHEFDPGPALALGAAWRALDGPPFVVLSALLSFSAADTHPVAAPNEHASYRAFDLRLGAVAGITLLDIVSPYLLARVFGGPVFWHDQGADITGTDVSHFQVGLGLAAQLGERFQLFAEGVPLGEQALSAGVAAAL